VVGGRAISDDDRLTSGPFQSHIHKAHIFQKTDLSLTVGTHPRDDHSCFFAPLETTISELNELAVLPMMFIAKCQLYGIH